MTDLKKIVVNNRTNGIYAVGSISFIIIIIAIFFIWRSKRYKVDADNETKIMQLHPKLRHKARKFLSNAKRKGFDLRITESLRTWDRQSNLYAQGRTTAGQIVTNAPAGSSFHNYGLAFDIVDRKNGYNANWSEIGVIGKKAGFTWGGDWKNFKDNPHFQLDLGYKIADLRNLYKSGKWTNYAPKQSISGLNGNLFEDFADFVEKSLKYKTSKKPFIFYVNTKLAREIKKTHGINTDNWKIICPADRIRHIIKEHGDYEKELKRNQFAVYSDDIKLIPSIVNDFSEVNNAKGIEQGKERDAIEIMKIIQDGKYIVIFSFIVNEEQKYLHLETFYIHIIKGS